MTEVMGSFRRAYGHEFARKFYDRFLTADPRITELFKKTDFSRQRELFLHGILSLLDYADGRPASQMAIERLGERHSRRQMNIEPDMFPIWVDCLMKTIADLDPDFPRNWKSSGATRFKKALIYSFICTNRRRSASPLAFLDK